MSRLKNVQDAVWGHVDLESTEWAVVNSSLVQRLRRVHQLGMTMLVFPGTTHTRFEHSIGVCHVAGRIADSLIRDHESEVAFTQDDRRIARLAGLLHDLGHGPFSHVSDKFLGKKGHERVGAMMLKGDPELRNILDEDTRTRIGSILLEERPRTVVRDIVSGPADADKADYLLRDSHYAGVQQGHFDYHHYIDQAVAIRSRPDTMLGFRSKGLWSVEGMLLARYHMHRTVYGHPKRILTNLMLQRGMEQARDEGLLPQCLFEEPTEDRYDELIDAYRRWDDWSVLALGSATSSPHDAFSPSRSTFARLRNHQLPKLAVFLEGPRLHEALGFEAARALDSVSSVKLDDVAHRLELELSTAFSVASDLVYVRLEDPENPLDRPSGPIDEEIVIITREGKREDLRDRSEVFRAVVPKEPRRKLYVFVPAEIEPTNVGDQTIDLFRDVLVGHES